MSDYIISETIDPYMFTALAVGIGGFLLNKLLSTNPSIKYAAAILPRNLRNSAAQFSDGACHTTAAGT